MARMPGARWLGEHGNRSMSRYDIVCIHTIVGYAPAHAAHFSTDGGGEIYQSRDTRHRSAANLNGNHRVIAIENADHGPGFPRWNINGSDVPALTDAQIEAIAQILAWAHTTHGIPLELVPDSKSSRRGIAYHRLGCDPYRVSGGELWSSAYGKVCPGDERIAQIPSIINRAKQIVAGGPTTEQDWSDMLTKAEVKEVLAELLDERGVGRNKRTGKREPLVTTAQRALLRAKIPHPTLPDESWEFQAWGWSVWWYEVQNHIQLKTLNRVVEQLATGVALTDESVAAIRDEVTAEVVTELPPEVAEEIADRLGAAE